MKHRTWVALLTLACTALQAHPAGLAAPDPERPLWLRTPAVSPDGSRIAFTHGGQIWVVPAAGGDALALTDSRFYSHKPVWSPDSQRIAFASARHGNADVFVMPAAGGAITRLTHHSSQDIPEAFTPDGREILFSANRLGSPQADALDASKGLGGAFQQLYAVNAGGGRARMVLPTPALDVAPSADGTRLLYHDRRSTENEWRKHHRSEAARDIWLHDMRTGQHTRLSDFRGEDRNPVWSADESAVYWLSERSGSANIWRRPMAGGGEPQQITFHQADPVRFLSRARDGTLVYGFDGEIWKLPPGASQPQRVPVRIRQGNLLAGDTLMRLNDQISEFAVSPTAPEYAVVARGEVFVVSALSGSVRRITSTPAEERGVSFSPDGRRLLYASERNGRWDVFEARLRRDADKGFAGAAPFDEKALISGPDDAFQPVYSPDGQRVAYRLNRNAIHVFTIATGKSVQVLGPDAVYSYQDGDLNYAWAPNGRWLVSRTGFESTAEIELLDAEGKEPRRNISRSGFTDLMPQVSDDGNMVLWLSDRVGPRTATSEATAFDVVAAFLTDESFEAFRASPDERLRRAQQQAEAGAAARPDAAKADRKPTRAALPDLRNLQRRTVRLTPFSVVPAFYRLTPDGRTLVVVTEDPGGLLVGYAIDIATRSPRMLFQRVPTGVDSFQLGAQGKLLFAVGARGIDRYDLATGESASLPFTLELARDAQAEVSAIFEHAWRLTRMKFYDPKLHGVDWDRVGASYRKFLPYVRHWEELAEILSEMVGELNASHQGGYYFADASDGDATASLGLYYDEAWRGAGQRVAEVMAGGPADKPGSLLKPGATIVSIDGQAITAEGDVHRLLNRKAGQSVMLGVRPAGGGAVADEVIVPVSPAAEVGLAYQRWVDKRRALVERLSGGRLAYIHIPGMDLPSYLRVFGDLFGPQRDAEAVLVDVRFNGGGNLHDTLMAMLSGQLVASNVTRDGARMETLPTARWTRPSAMLANAGSYSDGSIVPSFYQRLKLGPIIGQAVPGTGTAVVWERQIEKRLVYGVPQLGFRATDGSWFENQEIVPEVPVDADPASVAAGRDVQLERAVQELLQRIGPRRQP